MEVNKRWEAEKIATKEKGATETAMARVPQLGH